MTPNFINGVLTSYKSGEWEKFIAQFGTSYVTEVIMGGRATQEIAYDSEQLSQMLTSGTTIEVAAKASFRKLYG